MSCSDIKVMLQVSAQNLPLSTETKLQQFCQHLCIWAHAPSTSAFRDHVHSRQPDLRQTRCCSRADMPQPWQVFPMMCNWRCSLAAIKVPCIIHSYTCVSVTPTYVQLCFVSWKPGNSLCQQNDWHGRQTCIC
jgi:hypothetical protein